LPRQPRTYKSRRSLTAGFVSATADTGAAARRRLDPPEVNTEILINAIVQQTMVFVARLATAGGVRAPLAHVADQVFVDLTEELRKQGVKKKVIADMFGMALRTYHRRAKQLA